MNYAEAARIMRTQCVACGRLLAEDFADAERKIGDSGWSLLLDAIQWIGADMCLDCCGRLPDDHSIRKKYKAFAKQLQSGQLLPTEMPDHEIKQLANTVLSTAPRHPDPSPACTGGGSSPVQIHLAPGEPMMMPGRRKAQMTYHVRAGGSVNKAFCEVKKESIDIVVIDDEQVRVGCRYYSQGDGGWFEGPRGTCSLRSNIFANRKCIFHHD